MRTVTEFLEERRRTRLAAAERQSQARRMYVSMSEASPPRCGIIDEDMKRRVWNQTLLRETDLTEIICDACGYRLVAFFARSIMPQGCSLQVACGACGFSAIVPDRAEIGADWTSLLLKEET